MAQAWQVVPGQDWKGIARNEKGDRSGSNNKQKEWRMCWVRVGEEGKSEDVRDKNRGLKRKRGRLGVGSVMVKNQTLGERVTWEERLAGELEDFRNRKIWGIEGHRPTSNLGRREVVSRPRLADPGHPSSSTLAAAEEAGGTRRGKGFAVQPGRSVVELALARLVNEAALVLGPARTALPGAVLPL